MTDEDFETDGGHSEPNGTELRAFDEQGSGTRRRQVLRGLLASAGIVAATGGTAAVGAAQSTDTFGVVDAEQVIASRINDVHYVGTTGEQYRTIAAAHDDLPSTGGTIAVTPSYTVSDAESNGETLPIEITKPVSLVGTARTGTRINAQNRDSPVIDLVRSPDMDLYDVPVVQNLRIEGGSAGLRIRGSNYSVVNNCTFQSTHGPSVVLDTHPSELDEGTWGTTIRDCHIYAAEGHGIVAEQGALPNAVTIDGVKAHSCDGCGIRVRSGGGASVTVSNCVLQHNGEYGLWAEDGAAMKIENIYFEENGDDLDATFDLRARAMHQMTVDTCYFQGFRPDIDGEGTPSPKAIQFRDGGGYTLRNCRWNNYETAIVRVLGDTTDVTADRSTCSTDDTEDSFWLTDPGSQIRARHGDVIVEQDLSDVTGKFNGDRAISDGTNTSRAGTLCIWSEEQWVPTDGSQPF